MGKLQLHRLLSRSMIERSVFCWILEFATQFMYYCGLWLVDFPAFVHHVTKTYLDGDYGLFYKYLFHFTAMLPWTVAGIFYFGLYWLEIPCIEKYRLQEWVWKRGDEKRSKQYMLLLRNTALTLVWNNYIMSYFVGGWIFYKVFDTTRDLVAYTDNMPSCWENFWKIMVALLMFDTGFYWSHRLFHERGFVKKYLGNINLYKYHKDHHAYYVPTAFAGAWLEFWDGQITSVACGFIPAYLLNMHSITFFLYSMVNITHSCYDHAGYHLPYDPMQQIPFGSHNDSHNAHHSMNHENYGLYWRHWDVLCDTDKMWVKYEQQRLEALDLYMDIKSYTQSGEGVYDTTKYTFVYKNNQIELYYAGFVVKDGVALVNNLAETQEILNGEDNLQFTQLNTSKNPLMQETKDSKSE